jgi:hypothetical protein
VSTDSAVHPDFMAGFLRGKLFCAFEAIWMECDLEDISNYTLFDIEFLKAVRLNHFVNYFEVLSFYYSCYPEHCLQNANKPADCNYQYCEGLYTGRLEIAVNCFKLGGSVHEAAEVSGLGSDFLSLLYDESEITMDTAVKLFKKCSGWCDSYPGDDIFLPDDDDCISFMSPAEIISSYNLAKSLWHNQKW